MSDQLIAQTSTCTTQHSQQTDIISPVAFEPTVSTGERLQTYVLDRAAIGTGISRYNVCLKYNNECPCKPEYKATPLSPL